MGWRLEGGRREGGREGEEGRVRRVWGCVRVWERVGNGAEVWVRVAVDEEHVRILFCFAFFCLSLNKRSGVVVRHRHPSPSPSPSPVRRSTVVRHVSSLRRGPFRRWGCWRVESLEWGTVGVWNGCA